MKLEIYTKGTDDTSYFMCRNIIYRKRYDKKSVNQTSWLALIEALQYIIDNEINNEIVVYIDSLLIYRQVTHVLKVKSKNLKPLKSRFYQLMNVIRTRNNNKLIFKHKRGVIRKNGNFKL